MVRVGQKAAMVAFILLASACASNPPPPQQQSPFPKETIFVGVTPDHPGFSTEVPGTAERRGFDVDLARWLASRLKKKVWFVNITLEERVEVLKKPSSGIDMVISTFSINDDRRKYVDFAGPYLITRQGAMVRKGDDRIKDVKSLTSNNRHICVPSGTTSHDQLKDFYGDGVILAEEPAQKKCFDNLINGEVEAFSTDLLILHGFAKEAPSKTHVIELPLGAYEQYGIGLPNNDRAKCEAITPLLREFIDEGHWENVLARNLELKEPQKHKPSKLDPCE